VLQFVISVAITKCKKQCSVEGLPDKIIPRFTFHRTRGIQKLSHLVAQFEVRTLKPHVSSWGCFQYETEVDVHQSSLAVHTTRLR
jgi:hypothetical protein